MSKYALLALLNVPFVLFGALKAWSAFKKGRMQPIDFSMHIVFWLVVLSGLVFSEKIYNLLVAKGLTDSTPLSLADVVLVTGLNFCLFLILRLYSKTERLERRMTDLHEQLSLEFSKSHKQNVSK